MKQTDYTKKKITHHETERERHHRLFYSPTLQKEQVLYRPTLVKR